MIFALVRVLVRFSGEGGSGEDEPADDATLNLEDLLVRLAGVGAAAAGSFLVSSSTLALLARLRVWRRVAGVGGGSGGT